jgi:hypothetical protein
MSLHSRLLPFIGKAIVVVIVASIPWYFMAPFYNRLLAIVAEWLISSQLTLLAQQDTILIYSETSTEPIAGIYASAIHYGLLLVISLIAVTPGIRLVRRLRFIGITIIIMLAIHIISVVLFANAAASGNAISMRQDPLIIFFTILGCDLFPALIWGIIAFKYYLPEPGNSPLRVESSKNRVKKR